MWRNEGRHGWRLAAIGGLGLVGLPCVQHIAASAVDLLHALGWWQLGLTLVAVGLIWLAFAAPVEQSQRARRMELGALLAVAVAWRAVAFVAPPHLSLDAYRYLWDAHLLIHGVSPYTHVPVDPSIATLRDAVVWPILTFRTVPTLYPPGAQGLFVLAGLIAPLNIWALKAAILACDLGALGLTMLLVWRAGLDLRRAMIYGLSPIPVIEFAGNGHVDALAIVTTLGAVVLATGPRLRGYRFLAGVLLGLATLTKLYPLLFAIVLLRRRDWGFLAGLVGTVALGYLVMLPIGIGGGGFLGTYFQQRFVDEGLLQHYLGLGLGDGLHFSRGLLSLAEFALIAAGGGLVAWWRLRHGLGVATGILAISAIWILLSPHIFPWYVALLLPPLALQLHLPGEVAFPGAARASAAWGFWLFTLLIPFTYVLFAEHSGYNANWFELWFYLPALISLAPRLWAHIHQPAFTKGSAHAHLDLAD